MGEKISRQTIIKVLFKCVCDEPYLFVMRVPFESDSCSENFDFTVAKKFVCYHNHLADGIFDDYIPDLLKLYEKFCEHNCF